MDKTITKLVYNWFFTSGEDEGEGYEVAEVGKNGVIRIDEIEDYLPTPCYLIHFDDGKMIKTFNPNTVSYKPEEE